MKEMAPGTRVGPPFQAPMATKMDTQSRRAKDVASGASGYSSRLSSASDIPRHPGETGLSGE